MAFKVILEVNCKLDIDDTVPIEYVKENVKELIKGRKFLINKIKIIESDANIEGRFDDG